MVGTERPRRGPPVQPLQHRCLDLDEAAVVQEATHLPHHGRAPGQQLADFWIGDQVEVAATQARLHVGQAVPLVRRRAQRLSHHHPGLRAHRLLARAGEEDGAVGADVIAQVDRLLEQRVLLRPQRILGKVKLQATGGIVDLHERRLTHDAQQRHPAGDGDDRAGLRQFLKLGVDFRAGVRPPRARGKRLDAGRAQSGQLGPAGGDELIFGERRLAHK